MSLVYPSDLGNLNSGLATILVHPGEGRLYFTKPSLAEMNQIYVKDVPYTPAIPSFLPENITVAQVESKALRAKLTSPKVEEWMYLNTPLILFAVSTGLPLSSSLHSFVYEGALPEISKERLAFLHLAAFCQEYKLENNNSTKQKFNLIAEQLPEYARNKSFSLKIEDFDTVRRTIFPFNKSQISILRALNTKKFIKILVQDQTMPLGFPLALFERSKDEIPFLLKFGILDELYGDIFITEFGEQSMLKFERSQFKLIQ